jgi:predicted aldo/keto reductase-like oxidoreductase
MKRREFLSCAAAAATLFPANAAAVGQAQDPARGQLMRTGSSSNASAVRIPRITHAGERRGEMLYRDLGKTGVQVSVIGLGGSHLGQSPVTEEDAIHLIHEGLDRGINFLDNAWDYNEGRSEERVGKALSQGGYRDRAFVMTKIDGRTRETAADQIDDSLKRLRVDHIDLLQHHEVIRFDDPDRIFNEGGSMEAVLAAKTAGKVRFIGFTGHKDPRVHLYMLEVAGCHGFHFDTVQLPINIMDAHFRSFAQLVVPEALQQDIAVLGMKCFGSGVLLKSDILKTKSVTPIECFHYCFNLPISVQITGVNSKMLLDQAFAAVQSFRPMDEAGVAALIARSEEAAMNGKYELFKTTSHFDTTARHPDWLGSDSLAVQQLAPQLPG